MEQKLTQVTNKELINIIACRKGGKTTLKIIDELLEKPQNANQLSKKLKLNYNTITHHIKIINDHEYIIKTEFNKQYYYYPSKKLLNNMQEYKNIKTFINKK